MDLKHVSCVLLLFVTLATCQQCTSPTDRCGCYIDESGLKVINCRYSNLTQVPAFTSNGQIYDRITFISTEETGQCKQPDCNDITSLPADAFANLNVKVIDLRNNAVHSFDQSAFRGLETVLNGLLIEGDGNISPPYTSVSGLQNLRSLHLENFQQNDMTTLNTNLNFPELLTLTLNKLQGVSVLHENVFINIPKVTELNIQRMHSLTDLPVPAIIKLQSLTMLNIFDTWISQIYGKSFKQLNNLISIHLDSNEKLVTLASNAFDGVEDTLEFLYMSQNALTESALNIFPTTNWPALTQLHLGYNYFTTIPAGAFRTMPNLVYLELQDVSLSSISNSMFNGLSKLHTLDLGYNQITDVATETFRNNPELRELRINEQQTNGQKILFAANAFQGVETSLQRLFIEKNKLEARQLWQIIRSFTNILELNLADIGLTEIPDRAFRNNVKLSTLVLSENNITKLSQETFYGPRSTLTSINMNYNQIQTISKCVFSDFTTPPSIRIIGNVLACDCRVAWLYDWVKQQPDEATAAFSYVGKCSSPDSLKDKFFNMFDRYQLICPPGYVEPVCPDLYTTTSTTTTSTTNIFTSPMMAIPAFNLIIVHTTATSVKLFWTVSDKTVLKQYRLSLYSSTVLNSTNSPDYVTFINRDQYQYTFSKLIPGMAYKFCLALVFTRHQPEQKCISSSTIGPGQATTHVLSSSTTPASSTSAKSSSVKPALVFLLFVKDKKQTRITFSWTISDRSDVKLYVMELSTDNQPTITYYINKDHSEFTIHDLLPGHSYYACLSLMYKSGQDVTHKSCETASTLVAMATTNTPSTGTSTNDGVIIG